ncbi:MAG: hypothetical protein A2X18_07425 [Bacteroidetes bacterium GWF2_40_14]|nr:MAG: hypothetical protein A2X18_07425 [Bacteroidetes bacterium GWF2_40_14]
MKKILFVTILLFSINAVNAQKKSLDESVYDKWMTVEKFVISDDAGWTFTEYKNFTDKSVLDIKIKKVPFRVSIKGGSGVQLFNNQMSAFFYKKDTLYTIQRKTGKIDSIGIYKNPETKDDSPYLTFKKGKTLFIRGTDMTRTDSVGLVAKSMFITHERIAVLQNENGRSSLIVMDLKGKNGYKADTVYRTDKYIADFSGSKSGNSLVFFQSKDTLFNDTETVLLDLKSKEYKILTLNKDLLPANMEFNVKKGITFSSSDKYLKFDISPWKPKEAKSKVKAKAPKNAYEFELWRWNDTLLPIQKDNSTKVFENSQRCSFYPESGQFVRLTQGYGVFLQPDDNSPYGFEFNDKPYMYNSSWEDPTPKDLHCVNALTGERKLLIKGFFGAFALSPSTPQIFTYNPIEEGWYVTDLNTMNKTLISSKLPYPVKEQDFDKPQPAGAYGQAGMTLDMKYFIVYDQFDVWALPVSGVGEPFCITNGFGRRNNIRFKVLKLTERGEKTIGVDLKSEILLEAVNKNNMNSGFYKVKSGNDPVKLIENEYKYSFVKQLGKDKYIIKRESFKEAPDYWLTNKNFQLSERLTDMNDQLKDYKVGDSKVIRWNDKTGMQQAGVLYTPEGYDSTKKYPVIVYFYETMSQNAFVFYPPAPTTSTINPVMFVSRGYVVFMPDITYEIGWPGKSCVNTVIDGTRHLINTGIADPEKIGVEGHSWGGYQVAFLITQTDLFTCACSEAAVANMTSAYTGIRAGAGKPRMFMYESSQSRIGGTLWDKQENYIKNSPVFYLDKVTTPLLSRHSDGDEAVPYSQGIELFLGLKRLGKEVWMFNYKGDGHNIKKREIAVDWSRRMDEYFDYYLMDKQKPKWMN